MHANDKLVMIKDGRGSCHTLAGEQVWELSKTFSGRVGAKGGILPLQDGSFVFYHYSHVIDAVVQVVLVNAQGYAHPVWLAPLLVKATMIAHTPPRFVFPLRAGRKSGGWSAEVPPTARGRSTTASTPRSGAKRVSCLHANRPKAAGCTYVPPPRPQPLRLPSFLTMVPHVFTVQLVSWEGKTVFRWEKSP